MKAGRRTAQELRQAIDCLPVRTREAMLDGIGKNTRHIKIKSLETVPGDPVRDYMKQASALDVN